MQTEYRGSKYMALLEEFRNLGVGGIFFRSKYELSKKLGLVEKKHIAGRLSTNEFLRALDLESDGLDGVIGHFKTRESPQFFFNWRERKLHQQYLWERFADQEAQLIKQADEICQHKFEIFGSSCVEFDSGVNWHLEPVADRSWSHEHWSKIDIRGQNRIGDVRLTWELNRHQFFFTLGRAYWHTGDEKYAREFASLMRSWLDANPPEMGVNWYSNLEIAIRLISWIWAYHYFLDSPFFDDDLRFDFLRTVLQSCRHIIRDFQYSLRSMNNNHVIGDAAGLAFAGIMFPEFKESKSWRDISFQILYRELDNQVYDDGTDFEQAIAYHRFVLYFYVLILRIMQINGYSVPARVPEKLEKMAEFIMHAMKPDGTMPPIGDSDDAKVLHLNNDKPDVLTPILSTGAVLFQRGDFKKIAGSLSEETFWLCGRGGIDAFDLLEESPPSSQSRGFPDGGYYVMRSGWDADARYMLFKCGAHADHGHADALHIELYCGGKSRLRDSGTYTYNASWEWRTFFRSTKAHNTAVVDGESQSIPHRAFRWLKPAKTKTIAWSTSSAFDYIDAEHYGYNRYKNPVTHRRAVFFVKQEYWVVVDQLTGRGEHSIELLFHTLYGEHKLETPAKIFRSQGFSIIPLAPDDLCPKEPLQGWFSPCYGIKQPSAVLGYDFTGKLPKTMVTILDPGCPILDARQLDDTAINIELERFSDTLIFNLEREESVSQAGVEADAAVAYLRTDKESGETVCRTLVSGNYIRLNGKPLANLKPGM